MENNRVKLKDVGDRQFRIDGDNRIWTRAMYPDSNSNGGIFYGITDTQQTESRYLSIDAEIEIVQEPCNLLTGTPGELCADWEIAIKSWQSQHKEKVEKKYEWDIPSSLITKIPIGGIVAESHPYYAYVMEIGKVFYVNDVVTTYDKKGRKGEEIPEDEIYIVTEVMNDYTICVNKRIPHAMGKKLWRMASCRREYAAEEQQVTKTLLNQEAKNYINKNKHLWSQSPGMDVEGLILMQTGTEEQIREWLKKKQEENDLLMNSGGVPDTVIGVGGYDKEVVQAEHDRIIGKDIVITEEEMQHLQDKALERMGEDAARMIDQLWDDTKPAGNGFYDKIKIDPVVPTQEMVDELETIKKLGYLSPIDPIQIEEGKPVELSELLHMSLEEVQKLPLVEQMRYHQYKYEEVMKELQKAFNIEAKRQGDGKQLDDRDK